MKTLTQQEKQIASQLKARLWLAVAQIVDQTTATTTSTSKPTASPQFVAALVELVYNQALALGEDIEAFARHAGRDTVQVEDVFMVTRRNTDLTQLLQTYLSSIDTDSD